jgi:hypothetical protein
VALQAKLAKEGLEATLQSVCGIQEGEPLAALVRAHYRDVSDRRGRIHES